jgi:hypothetical protein
MKKTLFIAFFFAVLLVCLNAMSQELIKTGPFGEPLMVMDAGGEYTIPIKIKSNADTDMYIPDITRPGWIAWNKDNFQKRGKYWTYLYQHFKTDVACHRNHKGDPNEAELCHLLRYERRTISVDVRANTLTILDAVYMPNTAMYHPSSHYDVNITLSLAEKKNASWVPIINRITAIIEKEMTGTANTPSAQDVVQWNSVIGHQSFLNSLHGERNEQQQCEYDCLHQPGAGPGKVFNLCIKKCGQ